MRQDVKIVFGRDSEYAYRVDPQDLAAVTEDDAQRWLDDEWGGLNLQPVRPTGKVLVLDKIMGIARGAGAQRFAADGEWARTFARTVALLLKRPTVVVDVWENRVG